MYSLGNLLRLCVNSDNRPGGFSFTYDDESFVCRMVKNASHRVLVVISTSHIRRRCLTMKTRGWILKCFLSRDINSLIRGFITYVRPRLEYCTVAWNPSLRKDIESLEKVQRRFTKRLPGLRNLTYCQRLARLQLKSLELRRLRFDLIFICPIAIA